MPKSDGTQLKLGDSLRAPSSSRRGGANTASALTPTRFERIRLENWRNFTRADVQLRERNFLVGPNASGKSNFLDAFRFLSDLVSVGGGLESAISDREGVSAIRCLAARKQPHVAIDVQLAGNGSPAWRYRLSFSQVARHPQIEEESVFHGDDRLLHRPDTNDRADPERLRQTHLEQLSANVQFRVVAEFFKTIRYFHIVPQLIRESERWDSPEVDPFGGDFLERILQTPANRRNAWLRRIQSALGIAGPKLSELVAERDNKGIPHLRGRYEHWRPQGAWQDERQFSDGTLRLLGLLWSLLSAPGPLLLEEPELSLHSEVVRYIPQLMARVQGKSRHQILLSTHSPDLLRDRGIAPDEVFLFAPSKEGTTITSGAKLPEVRRLLDSGLSVAEAVLPLTRPPEASQLALSLD